MFSELVTKAVFENCLQVTIRKIPHARTLNIGLFINHGVKDEENHVNGISHFIEHIAFNYANMSPYVRSLLGNLMDNGALYEAFTGKEMTRCTLSAQREHMPLMIETLSQIMMNYNVSEKSMEHERAIILHEAEMYFSSGKVKEELVEQALWGNRSLGQFVIGSLENIRKFTFNQLEERIHQYYIPNNTQLIVQGSVEPEEVIYKIGSYFRKWKHDGRQKDVLIEIEPSVVGLPTGHSRVDLSISFVGAPFHSHERQAMSMLSYILGTGLKSRLHVELREKQELAYIVYAYAQSYALSGYLTINVNCRKDQLAEVYKVIRSILEELRTEEVGEEELQRAKAARITNLMQIPGNDAKHLQITGRYALLNKDFFVDLEKVEIEALTAEELKTFARDLFTESRMALSAIGASSEELAMLL
ncbi:Predicted Zn-dependent peptidase [Paenibacillus tianmuensis]|uniref:Predicted Zn-dependent peptidase n=1 Tax=Paenibacillus tianmuensis TaxID=624147 RepID=A0A1G4SS04_9BACL|nr:pitrilysin family protein [Paenibacillus tianmuensis]SCW71727.1 Predicted Zn-dependent peptidase [Paenibacillus tianmuensis]